MSWVVATGSTSIEYSTGAQETYFQPGNFDISGSVAKGLAYSPDGKYLGAATVYASVGNRMPNDMSVVFGVGGGQVSGYIENGAGGGKAIAFSPDSVFVAAGGGDMRVAIWKPRDVHTELQNIVGRLLGTYTNHSAEVMAIAWSRDGKLVASGSADRTVQVWDPMSFAVVLTITTHSNTVNAVTWAPDGSRVASASDDGTVHVSLITAR